MVSLRYARIRRYVPVAKVKIGDADRREDSFDYAAFLPEYGGELPFTLMTTAHHEQVEEALWFAFYCAKDEELELNAVVVVVDSEKLERQCRFWLENNEE